MRIGQFTDSYPPIINGVSAFLAEHHAQLLSQGHDAHIFTFGYTGARDDQRNVWRTAGLPIFTSGFRMNLWLNAPADRAAQRLDVYHAHETFAAGRLALKYALRSRRPMLFTNHTRHDLYIRNYPRLVQPFLRRGTFGLIAKFMRHSVAATAPSVETADLMRRIAPDAAERVQVIRNGVRLDQFDNAMPHESRGVLGIARDATVFMYVGRLTPEKNLSALAEAMRLAIDAGANAHWVVIGDGPCRDDLEQQLFPIAARTHFLGAVPRAEVPAWLAMADVFATPSLSEVNPVSVIEALASGKPYVGLCAGWWNEFEASRNGHLPPGCLADDAHDLAHAIVRLSADAPTRAGMGAAAKALSRRFDIRDITAQWIEMYQAAIING